MDESQARLDALAFLKRNHLGAVATISPDRKPHASIVGYTADENFNVYFLTPMNTRKYEALRAHPEVAFTVFTADIPQTLQLEGMATDISLSLDAAEKKEDLFELLRSNPYFYAPITKLDPAESAVIWIQPKWIRWADYAFEKSGSENVFKEITLNI
jgi:uncharacterized pyridoxamine 5'-phosphate oxidase family protein